jgi:hypothetical protein
VRPLVELIERRERGEACSDTVGGIVPMTIANDHDGHRYLLPVADLTLSRDWIVGDVTFLPAGRTRSLVDQQPAARDPDDLPDWSMPTWTRRSFR